MLESVSTLYSYKLENINIALLEILVNLVERSGEIVIIIKGYGIRIPPCGA
jgi:hypothetical protein